MTRAIAGVDGCKAGWVAAIRRPGQAVSIEISRRFEELVDALPDDAVIAVDMPIGLPDYTRKGGRGPEMAVRPLLGARQSSVFSIPSRSAVYAETDAFTSLDAWYEAHRRASIVARATSDPPRAISIQAFGIFSKIREIDGLLRERPDLRGRVHESHPEVAFWRLNGERAMSLPRKSGAGSIRRAWKSGARCSPAMVSTGPCCASPPRVGPATTTSSTPARCCLSPGA